MESYNKAKVIILANEELCNFIGPPAEELIDQAEQKLGFKFKGSYLDFLISFGAGNFGAEEIFGIISNDFENSSVPDAVWYTLTERKEDELPNNLLVIYETGGDEVFCLDFNNIKNGEPKKFNQKNLDWHCANQVFLIGRTLTTINRLLNENEIHEFNQRIRHIQPFNRTTETKDAVIMEDLLICTGFLTEKIRSQEKS